MCKIEILPVKVTLFTDVLQPQTKDFSSGHTHNSEVLFKTDNSSFSCKAWPSLNQLFCPPAHTGIVTEAAPNTYLCHRSILTFTWNPSHTSHSPFSTQADRGRMQEANRTQGDTLSHRAASTSGTSTQKPDQQEQWKCPIKNVQSQWKDCLESSKHSRWD